MVRHPFPSVTPPVLLQGKGWKSAPGRIPSDSAKSSAGGSAWRCTQEVKDIKGSYRKNRTISENSK